MPTIFAILITLYLGGNLYIFKRGAQTLVEQSTGVKILLTFLFWGIALSFFVCFLSRDCKLPTAWAHTLYEVGNGWLVFTLYMVLCLLFFDILKFFNSSFKQGFYVSLFLTLSLLSYGYYQHRHPSVKVINIDINKPLLHYEHPVRIVSVSDVHLGYGTDKEELQEYITRINGLHPDLICIAGDLIDNSVTPLYQQQMMEELSQLKAPLGIYMVPGNHEYISNIRKSIQFLQETPIRLLRDEVVTLPNGLQIVGRDDRSNRTRCSLSALIEQTDSSRPILLLDHQPFQLAETAEAGVDIQFSGHTHHGQIWPISLITDYLFDQSYGYRQWGKSHIYVSSGLSLWGPPYRIGTEGEIVLFQITCK